MGMLVQGIGDRCAALQDTTMGTAPRTTAGAGASAPAPEGLTIDRNALRDIWLPAERRESSSLAYMKKLFARAAGRHAGDVHEARMAIEWRWRETVEMIRKRGGLLHIGCAV